MKVKFVPYQPHCFAFGGFEVQMLSTLDAIVKSGVEAEKIDIWSRDNNFEILHCWGLGFHHYENIRWARHAKKKIVLTALLSYYENFNERLRHLFSTYIKKAQYYIEIANMADCVVVVNELQAEACHRYFKVPLKKIQVIPNIIHNKYFENKPDNSFFKKYNVNDYVLAVGNVCVRKNQLALIEACLKSNSKLVIIGTLLDGEAEYGKQVEKLIQDSTDVIWVQGLPSNSDDLISAYQGSTMVALPSFIEQQPITLLEAVAIQKPLLIAERAYAHQKYYKNSMCVPPNSIEAIANGINKVKEDPLMYTPSRSTIEECREENVAKRYNVVYDSLL